MLFALLRPFRFLAKALSAQSSPNQMAWGFALGVAVGLVPKGNLLAILLMTVLGAAKVNLAAGMMAAFAFSWIAMPLDLPVLEPVGAWLLSRESLFSFWTWMANAPILPWTNFNHAVVLGSFVVGLLAIYPSYRLSRPVFEKYAPPLAERFKKWWIGRLLLGTDIGGRIGSAASA